MPQQTERPTVRSHFDLRTLPFTREVAVRDRWSHEIYEDVVEALRRTVERRMSAGLIAPPGTGKSSCLRALDEVLPEARYRVHYVKVTSLSKRDFCREVAEVMGCPPCGHYPALVRRIQSRCVQLMDEDALRPVLLVDEAHDMRPEVLAILRILTNFEMDSRLVASFVLAGQPPLKKLLRRADLEAVARRIAHYETLRLLSRAETRTYVAHRLQLAGAESELLDEAAHDAIYESAQGNLRAIDRLALETLEVAAAQGDPVCGADHVAAARKKVRP